MLAYTVFINSAFAFLIVLALILAGGEMIAQSMLLNFLFYVIFTEEPYLLAGAEISRFRSDCGL